MTSGNQFTRHTFPSSSNASVDSIVPSSNTFGDINFSVVYSVWKGDNIGGGAFGAEDPFGVVSFGIGEFGGISHFKNRTSYSISR